VSGFLALIGKDLRTELRTREVLTTTLVFPLLVLLVFRFAFETGDVVGMRAAAPGVVWASALFASILSLTRSFAAEKEDDRIYGLLVSPVDRGTLYLAKLCANLLFLLLVEAVTLLAFVLFFDANLLPGLTLLLPVVLLGTLAISSVGTLFAAMAVNTRAREALLPLLLFPVLTPVLLAALEYTRIALALGSSDAAVAAAAAAAAQDGMGKWMGTLVAFDVVFTTAGWLLFEHVVSDGGMG